MRYTINEIKDKTTPIAKAYGIGRMSLFGSYARGEAKEDSDVDLYIERGKLRSLLQYFAFIDDLENVLNCHVDVVTTGIEDKRFLSAIMQEGVLLYEE
ncbi:MAG: nucleotidyltransferase domain-containing protein [Lachnospiraceae bacterium]|nr:nucleotidyltransferase domain-containing protein [Lachnospiraceae bacterium]